MNIVELMRHIRKNKLSKLYFEPNEFDRLEIEMSNFVKSKDPETWKDSPDGVLATLSLRNITEGNFMCCGIPIIEATEDIQKDEIFQRKYIYALNLDHLSLIKKRKCYEVTKDI